MPLEHNRHFVGRHAQLKQLANDLKQGRSSNGMHHHTPVAICGMGGIGKSQLACEFAYRYGHYFTGGVFWLSSIDAPTLAADIAACGGQHALDLQPNFQLLSPEEQIAHVVHAWQQPTPRLLIFDNCEDPALIEPWIPRQGGCHILITSRRADWPRAIRLDVLERSASIALLQSHSPQSEQVQLAQIAHELGDLPLALHLAGSYLARHAHIIDAREYLRTLREAPPLSHQSLQSGAYSPTEHDLHVARTFAFSYDQLDQDDPITSLARVLLHAAACLAPGEPIPESLARLAINTQPEHAAAIAQIGFQIGRAISQLVDLGLLRAESNHTFSLHRLVAAFTRDCIGDALPRVQAAVEQAIANAAKHQNTQRTPTLIRDWQVHLRYVTDMALIRQDLQAADLAAAFAEHLYQIGDFRGACQYHQQNLTIRQQLLGHDHVECAQAHTLLGKALFENNQTDAARQAFEQALAILQHDPTTADRATTLNHLGYLLQSGDDLAMAKQCHQQALKIWRLIGGNYHPALVDSLSNLAFVAYREQRFLCAYKMLCRAIIIQQRATGDAHPETARLRTNLGEWLIAQGDPLRAEQSFRMALAIQERELGSQHPETARTIGGLGDVQKLLGNHAAAAQFYQQAFDIFYSRHGAEHARTKRMQERLASLASA